MFAAFQIPLTWSELLKRTAKESSEDDVLGLAAQLAYYFFLALFPAVLFILALASFFTLTNLIDDIVGALRPIAPADVLGFLEDQIRRISNADSGGILLDHAWRRDRHTALVRRLARLQVLPGELRGLQRHVRCSGRRHRSVVVVLHFGARHPGRRGTERRDRAGIAARQVAGRLIQRHA